LANDVKERFNYFEVPAGSLAEDPADSGPGISIFPLYR